MRCDTMLISILVNSKKTLWPFGCSRRQKNKKKRKWMHWGKNWRKLPRSRNEGKMIQKKKKCLTMGRKKANCKSTRRPFWHVSDVSLGNLEVLVFTCGNEYRMLVGKSWRRNPDVWKENFWKVGNKKMKNRKKLMTRVRHRTVCVNLAVRREATCCNLQSANASCSKWSVCISEALTGICLHKALCGCI